MCGDERARVVVKMLNTRRCDWPWPERIVTGEDIQGILRRLAVDEDEVTGWLRNCGQRVSIMDALIEGGYVYLDPRSAQKSYGPLCRSCEREVIVAVANFLVLHEAIRDRRGRAEKEGNA